MKHQTIDAVFADPVEFISRLTIKSKSGKLVRFGDVITSEQIELIRKLQKHKRVIIIKARQLGISTLVRAFAFWQAYTSRDPINSAVVSNKEKSSFNLLDIDRRFYQKLPKFLQRKISLESKSQIQFSANGTNLLAMTAKADSQDRGYTLNLAHLSEFAFYSNADTYLASLLASINDGQVVIESTPNYYGDALHELIRGSYYDNRWEVIFMPWSSFPEYRSDELVEPTEEEEELMEKHSLDIEQISWRRHKIAEMKSEYLFRREYPLTIEEAWTLTDSCYFSVEDLEDIQQLPYRGGEVQFVPPVQGITYSVGVDPAGGVGKDYSVATVISKLDHTVVAKISTNTKSINAFALDVINLAKKYNNAFIHFEENNHGHGFKEVLNANGYTYYKAFTTTAKSKISLYDQLRVWIGEGMISYLDALCLAEMRMLQSSDKGLAPSHPDGAHDDQVISFALAIDGLKYVKEPVDPHTRLMMRAYAQQNVKQINPLSAIRNR
jgi:hypothetical protein